MFAYETDKSFDILLLDIEMGGMDGVSLAKSVRAGNKAVQIIFITGYMEYIADGYEVEALHYLVKPVQPDKLEAVLDRAREKLAVNERALFIPHDSGQIRLPLYDIRYLEAMRNYTNLHAGETYRIKKPLAELEKELDDRFFRVGRSFIVNLRFVQKSTKTDVYLADGYRVPLSRGMYKPLNEAIIARL